ncbi:hypothetical protein ILYODFUR_036199 [Ilyodon furcidens]|uniref:Uncharacterized protein n=1 Tax=Ilyodon furcidens TaxID=33524 RepID=A0ABV0UY26_9TELE
MAKFVGVSPLSVAEGVFGLTLTCDTLAAFTCFEKKELKRSSTRSAKVSQKDCSHIAKLCSEENIIHAAK